MDAEKIKELETLISGILKYIPEIKESLDDAKDWDSPAEWIRNIGIVRELFTKILLAAKLAKETIDINDADLIDMITKKLDDVIKLPIYLEPFDGFAIKMLLHFLIEKVNAIIEKMKNKKEGTTESEQKEIQIAYELSNAVTSLTA
jgi:hypothetical protein